MGEIVCHYCNRMYSHLDFHDKTRINCECGRLLGTWCNICKERVCESCHLWEHVENTKGVTYYEQN